MFDLFAREPHRTPCDMRSRDQMSFTAKASICTIVLILRRRRPSILIAVAAIMSGGDLRGGIDNDGNGED